jgi:hypothetical protein
LVTKLYFSSFTSLQVLLTRFHLLLSTSIFMFSHASYIFKYSYIELKINFFEPSWPINRFLPQLSVGSQLVAIPPACSSFSS